MDAVIGWWVQPKWRAAWTGVRLAALGAIVYGMAVTGPGMGVRGRALAVLVCTTAACFGWLGWLAATVLPGRTQSLDRRGARAVALVVMVVAGSFLAGIDQPSPALALCGTGVFVAALVLRPAQSVALTGAGIITLAAGDLAFGQSLASAGSAAALLAIMLGGFNRRQYLMRLEQAEQLVAQTRRAQSESARAATLDERARIAREIHDVLAHSLGALAVQLDAADALLEDGGDVARAHGIVTRAHRMAVDGLNETRRAIGALRGDTLPLPDQLTALAAGYRPDTGIQAAVTVTGTTRVLPPEAEHTVYRTAQEAFNNVRKHSPEATVSIKLDYRENETVLTITDHPTTGTASTPAPLAGTGGGYGLVGLRERAEMIGGTLTAGPDVAGWTVRLRLPA
ncbi:sensor histidine kinase [Nonomuraea insulae]|uniref:histidine kinase n=1 Tax=Nonomuraea insulae TaxID=1616787 RepID=A0ABW1DFL7_9ACTN